jgi:hypothetical protein
MVIDTRIAIAVGKTAVHVMDMETNVDKLYTLVSEGTALLCRPVTPVSQWLRIGQSQHAFITSRWLVRRRAGLCVQRTYPLGE